MVKPNPRYKYEPVMHQLPGRLDNLDLLVVGSGVGGADIADQAARRGARVTVISDGPGRLRGSAILPTLGETNLGGMRFAESHRLVVDRLKSLGLTGSIQPFVNDNPNGILQIRGDRVRFNEYQKLAPAFDAESIGDPKALLSNLFTMVLKELDGDEGDEAIEEALCNGHRLGYETFRQYAHNQGYTDEHIAYLGHVGGIYSYIDTPVGELAVDDRSLYGSGGYFRLVPSSEILPRALMRRSGAKVIDGRVEMIDTAGAGVVVTYHTPTGRRSIAADAVVVSAPAPAVAQMQFIDPLPPMQQDAMREFGYASSAKTLIEASHPFWQDEGIDGGRDWTDLPMQQAVFPAGVPANTPSTFVGSYTWQSSARRLMALDPEERFEQVAFDLEQLHPGSRRHLRRYEHIDWDAQIGGGAFAYANPGDYARYFRLLSQAHPIDNPKVFFCGEHAGLHHGWAESALSSAQWAMINLLHMYV